MVLCEHFIFTSATLAEKSGYQVVSKSSNIPNKVLSELENYLYPTGTNLSEFVSSKSFLILKDYVSFTKVRNIGIGPDGRPDTLYSHTILMNREDFKKFNQDTRIFDNLYIEKTKPQHLTPILIEPKSLKPDFTGLDEIGIILFEYFLRSILSKKKIALVDFKSEKLIQSLLSLVPPTFREISFSTVVAEPVIQSKYKLIQIQKQHLPKSPSLITIDKKTPTKLIQSENSLYENCISHIIDIIDAKDSKKLLEIFQILEQITEIEIDEKIIFAVYTMRIEKESYQPTSEEISILLSILEKIEGFNIPKFLPSLNNFLDAYSAQQNAIKFESSRIISSYDKKELDIDILGKMFDEQSNGTPESRNILFHDLVKKRLKDFQKNGAKILGDIIQKFYNIDVIRGFVEEPKLHSAFEQVFDKNYELKNPHKHELFSLTVQISLCQNPDFLKKLFTFEVYNLQNDNHAERFRDTIKWLYSAREFHRDFKPEKIFTISKSIYEKIESIFPINQKSGTIEVKYYHMQEVLNSILNTLRYLLTVRRLSLDSNREKIQDFESRLSNFFNLNSLPNKSIYDLIPSSDIGKLVPTVTTWILFSTFSSRCKD